MKCKKCISTKDMTELHIYHPYWPGYECVDCGEEYCVPIGDHIASIHRKEFERKSGLKLTDN